MKFINHIFLVRLKINEFCVKVATNEELPFLQVSKAEKTKKTIIIILKLGIWSKYRLIWGNQSHLPLAGARSKPKQSSVWTCPSKLAPEEIEPDTFRGAHSKIPNQPLGQPQKGCYHSYTNSQGRAITYGSLRQI